MDIDLGKKTPGGLTEPSKTSEKDHVYYPSVYIDGGKELDALPDEGTITFRYKKTRESVEKRDGETNRSVSLDLYSITDVVEESSGKKDKDDAGDSLDKLADEEREKSEY